MMKQILETVGRINSTARRAYAIQAGAATNIVISKLVIGRVEKK